MHIAGRFADVPLDLLDRATVKDWIADMHRAGVGAHTIAAAARHLAKMLADAVDAGLLEVNPAARLTVPAPPIRAPFFWTRDEAAALLRELDGPMRTLVDLDLHTGLRIGEVTGLWCEQVDWQAGLLHVNAAQTRFGRERTPKGRRLRTVPIPAHLLDPLLELTSGRPGDAYVFTAARGGPIDDTHFRRRVFLPAVEAARVRRGTVHDMRHTAASWLVADGVDLYRVQALLGHESFRTTMRYAHLAPSAFDAITASWARGARPAHAPEQVTAVGVPDGR